VSAAALYRLKHNDDSVTLEKEGSWKSASIQLVGSELASERRDLSES